MIPSRKLNRRSFLAAVIGGGAVASGAALMIGRNGAVTAGNGITDSDAGRIADTAANGRGTPRGYTDSDLAPVRDAQSAGRGPGARSQSGPAAVRGSQAPAAATIRAPAASGCSDADIGTIADAGGQGRACANRRS